MECFGDLHALLQKPFVLVSLRIQGVRQVLYQNQLLNLGLYLIQYPLGKKVLFGIVI